MNYEIQENPMIKMIKEKKNYAFDNTLKKLY